VRRFTQQNGFAAGVDGAFGKRLTLQAANVDINK
jgi:hypothetical protein